MNTSHPRERVHRTRHLARATWTVAAVLALATATPSHAGPAREVPLDAAELARHADAHCRDPRPSPDGARIAWVVDHHEHRREVFARHRDDTEAPRQLVPSGAQSETTAGRLRRYARRARPTHAVCHRFAWEPAGDGYVIECSTPAKVFDVFHAPTFDRNPMRITDERRGQMHPRPVMAGGRRVIYADAVGRGTDLFVAPLSDTPRSDGEGRVRLTATDGVEVAPSWSPDGARVAYTLGGVEQTGDLYLIDVEAGARPTRLTRQSGAAVEPAWAPGGERVAYFLVHPDKRADLYVIAARAGASPTLVASNVVKTDGNPPAWTPDGRGLVYASREAPHHPLQIRWLDRGGDTRLSTGTLLNQAPAVVALDDGRWWIVWVAQARADDTEKRWDGIYSATVDPTAVRP